MTKHIDKHELAILSDVFATVASKIFNSLMTYTPIVVKMYLTYFFTSDKQRRKRTPYLLWAHWFRPSSLVSNPKWRPHDKGLQHSHNILKARRTPKFPSNINKPSLHVFVKKKSAKTRVVEKLKICASECAFCWYFWFDQTSRSLHSNDHYTQAGAAIFWSLQWHFSKL